MAGSLDQIRAAYAWTCVDRCSQDYVNLAKAAPALIMSNGLMQTLAFFKAKGKDHHMALLDHMVRWLARPDVCGSFLVGHEFGPAMSSLSAGTSDQYLRATQEALAILRWIRQLAAAAVKSGGR